MIRYTKRALGDLVAIGDYIAADNQAAAAKWIARLRERIERAHETPRAGRIVPELEREEVREVFLRTYRLVYRVESTGITVLTVFEGHRLLDDVEDDS